MTRATGTNPHPDPDPTERGSTGADTSSTVGSLDGAAAAGSAGATSDTGTDDDGALPTSPPDRTIGPD
jgi:hypothetical protein